MWAQAAVADSVITVEVHENGNAVWTIEKRLPLTNQTEIEDWEEFIRTGQAGNQTDIEDFSKRIEWFLQSAQKFSNRPMKAEKFNISYNTVKTLSGAFGIVQYSFEWKNFSHQDSGKILIGDAFSEGMVLSHDNVLVIKIPDRYELKSASPSFDKRDGNRLIWDGTLYRGFARGEPALVLTGSWNGSWTLIIALIGIVIGSSIIFLRRRAHNKSSAVPFRELEIENLRYEEMIENLKYEEMIERFLTKSGGQVSQSDIIKEIGLSKSRVSTILSKMKERGQIIKIKNGKGNLIRLAKKIG